MVVQRSALAHETEMEACLKDKFSTNPKRRKQSRAIEVLQVVPHQPRADLGTAAHRRAKEERGKYKFQLQVHGTE
jgi:hypothetical protein